MGGPLPGDGRLRGGPLTDVRTDPHAADPAPLIVALRLDAASFARLDALRRAHFPPARNRLAAHLTLFHALPGALEAEVLETLRALAAATPPLDVPFTQVRALGSGAALAVEAPALSALREAIARRFAAHLTRQDAQGWRPHVTLQNKADAATARRTLEALRAGFAPWSATGVGLDLWRYRGGPWEAAAACPFAGALNASSSSAASSSGTTPPAPAPP